MLTVISRTHDDVCIQHPSISKIRMFSKANGFYRGGKISSISRSLLILEYGIAGAQKRHSNFISTPKILICFTAKSSNDNCSIFWFLTITFLNYDHSQICIFIM